MQIAVAGSEEAGSFDTGAGLDLARIKPDHGVELDCLGEAFDMQAHELNSQLWILVRYW